MAILGNKNIFEEDIDERENYTLPAVSRESKEGISFKKSLVISTILHPTVAGLIWLIVFVLALMGITFSMFEKPKPKMNDIEFVLVDKGQKPLHKTHFRSAENSRTGGHRNPHKKVSMPSPTPHKASKPAGSKSATHRVSRNTGHKSKAVKHVQKQQNFFKQLYTPKKASAPKGKSSAKPKAPSARPSMRPPTAPKLSTRPHPQFAIPVPRPTGAPTGRTYSTGPIGGHGHSTSAGGGRGGSGSASRGYSAPVPSLAPTRSSGRGSGSGSSSGRFSSRGGGGYGNSGNPGGGGGRPGIDSMREPDFGPYMRDLQRRIKMNWDPPKGNESKRVVLLFKIARDGRLLSVRTFRSSGLPSADRAAINAVELTAPFRPLPAHFKGNYIDIQFTFDYNVFGASGYN